MTAKNTILHCHKWTLQSILIATVSTQVAEIIPNDLLSRFFRQVPGATKIADGTLDAQ